MESGVPQFVRERKSEPVTCCDSCIDEEPPDRIAQGMHVCGDYVVGSEVHSQDHAAGALETLTDALYGARGDPPAAPHEISGLLWAPKLTIGGWERRDEFHRDVFEK